MSDGDNNNTGGTGGLLDNLKKGWGVTVEKSKEIGAVAAEKTKQGWEVTVKTTNEGLSKSREFIHNNTKPGEEEAATTARAVETEEEKPNLFATIGKKTGEIVNTTKKTIYEATKPKSDSETDAKTTAGIDGDDDV